MPDQSSAATEHAIMQEITAPLSTLPDDPVPIAANIDFPLVLRGYDRLAVDAYVKKTTQLVAELQATRSPESAVRRALERVGEEVAGVLQRAHETAEQIIRESRREAEERLEAARREAASILADAERQLRDLDAETDKIWEERHRIVDDARELAAQLTALATDAATRFPAAEEEPSVAGDEADLGPPPAAADGGSALPEPAAAPDDEGALRADEEPPALQQSGAHADASELPEDLGEAERTIVMPEPEPPQRGSGGR